MRRAISWRESFCFKNEVTLRLRSSSNLGDPFGRMETPPVRMSLLYCITYAEVNNDPHTPMALKAGQGGYYGGV
jgi:hypothetical protein